MSDTFKLIKDNKGDSFLINPQGLGCISSEVFLDGSVVTQIQTSGVWIQIHLPIDEFISKLGLDVEYV